VRVNSMGVGAKVIEKIKKLMKFVQVRMSERKH